MAKANEIIEKEIGVHLNLIMIDGSQYQEKMNLMINTGDAWDLCFTANWFDFYNHAGKGAYADLTELLPTLAPETYSRIPEGLWQAVKGKSTLEALEMTGEFIGKALEKHPDMIGWETAEGGPLWKSDGI